MARIDQHDGKLRGGCAGGHVAGVLFVARRVGDDELAPRRGEIPVRHVDGDALLPLGAQAVGEQRKVQGAGRVVARGFANAGELVFVDRLRVEEEPADEGGFAVVHAAGGGEAEKFAHSLRSNPRAS
jgi:hypothetical protein